MSDNSIKKLNKKKKKVLDKSELVNEIIEKQRQTVKLHLESAKRKKHQKKQKLAKKMKKSQENGNEGDETHVDYTKIFKNGLESVSTPKKTKSLDSEIKLSDDSVQQGK